MRILLLDYEYPPLGGGASPVAARIAEGLVDRGHEIHAVTMGYRTLEPYENVRGVYINRVPSIRKRADICKFHELASYVVSARVRLGRLLRRERFDICHAHFAVPTGPLARWANRRFALPYVLTAHGSDIPGHNPERFKLEHRLLRGKVKQVLDGAYRVVAPSHFLLDAIRRIQPKVAERAVQIPNGIDTELYRPGDKERIILATGRLLSFKGFEKLVAAVSQQDTGFELHIAGDGPLRSELTRMAAESRTSVVLHGWLDNRSEEYRTLLSRAAIYALPSQRENASVALLEALSSGCAVITSNVSGCPETVGDAGLLVDPHNVDSIRRAIERLCSDQLLREQLQSKARLRAIELFGWERIVESYEHIFKLAVQENSMHYGRGGR